MHSRPTSVSSHMADINDLTPSETPNVPWEVVRWTKLRKIEGQAFSEIGKRKFGSPTAIAVLHVIRLANYIVLRRHRNRNIKRSRPYLRFPTILKTHHRPRDQSRSKWTRNRPHSLCRPYRSPVRTLIRRDLHMGIV